MRMDGDMKEAKDLTQNARAVFSSPQIKLR
jgi:hypothetical protein